MGGAGHSESCGCEGQGNGGALSVRHDHLNDHEVLRLRSSRYSGGPQAR